MKGNLQELAERRTRLQLKAARQRQQLGEVMDSLDERIRSVDHGIGTVRGFVQKPVILAGGAALLWFLGPRRALRWAGSAAFLIPLARRLLGFFR